MRALIVRERDARFLVWMRATRDAKVMRYNFFKMQKETSEDERQRMRLLTRRLLRQQLAASDVAGR